MTNSRSVPSRSSTTGPSTSGMTSPALRSTTVSPMSTPLAFTTCWLCSVAWRTSDPATSTFSMTANGVARPVRPTLTTMSRSVVLTSSGGYLYAVAHRGARLVAPSSSWSPRSSTLTTMPSIWCSTSARCAPCRRTNSVTSEMSSNTRKCVEMGRPQPASSPYTSDCADTWASLASSRTGHAPMPCTSMRRRRIRARMSSRRAGLLPSSFWRRDPAAAFRGFAKTRSPTSSCRAFSSSNSADGEEDLAAHLDERRVPGSRQPLRHRAHGEDVLRDVLPDDAVAARGRRDEDAVLVAEVDGEPVDLELAEVPDPSAAGIPLDLGGPLGELLLAEDVVEAEHALGVRHGREERGLRPAADGLRGAVLAAERRVRFLERLELVHERVVLGVAERARVRPVVLVAVALDLGAERVHPGGGRLEVGGRGRGDGVVRGGRVGGGVAHARVTPPRPRRRGRRRASAAGRRPRRSRCGRW